MSVELEEFALTTTAAVSAEVSGFTNDQINTAINAVSDSISRALGRQLHQQTFTAEAPDLYQGSGRPWLLVNCYPIVSVSSVKVAGQTVTDYRLIPDKARSGMLFRFNGWPRSVSDFGDMTRDHNFQWADYTIELGYVGGYKTPGQTDTAAEVTVPPSLELAARIAAVANLQGEDRTDGQLVQEKTPGGWERQWGGGGGSIGVYLSGRVLGLIRPFRKRP